MADYLVYSTLCTVVTYLTYKYILKETRLFTFNRFFLLAGTLVCLIAPLLEFSWGNIYNSAPKIEISQLISSEIEIENLDQNTISYINPETPLIIYLISISYIIISNIFIFRYFRNINSIIKSINSSTRIKKKDYYYLHTSNYQKYSYSFFRTIIIPFKYLKNKKLSDILIKHESTHARQLHTLDILLIEFIKCFFWFNPIIWFLKNEISENHEFIADKNVINQNINPTDYISQILRSMYNSGTGLTSGFSLVTTKNRLNMLTANNYSKRKKWIRLALGLIVTLFAFSFTSFNPDDINNDPFIVIIDAGHGGKDPGSPSEKDINLMISKEILNQSQNTNIKIILTRDSDEYISLSDRVTFINNQKADMFLSIHCNNSLDPEKNGPEGYFSDKNEYHNLSKKATEIVVSEQVNEFNKKGKIKTAGFKILKEINKPGVLLELGYMSNKEDSEFLLNSGNHKNIADNILKSLNKIEKQMR
ncbi:N-acetylmuramoyl-L-alanine amidase [Mangrovivirga cuniculi]|uniref:N-acetylmuramoyl-L-alanine amidase n=1 Tax=Mangrovivirga cuniculi TaxID=2715131 RepID=A0A4D7JPP2_9BACT|nr:N-acetylmuramoyl-L-alanine amidase [Mangrovivirga cuniculi]QCK16597.1 hypothetical protein DCC35_18615 [Mangrovivirga cuniculi]